MEQVVVYMTREDKQAIDAARGTMSRSRWIVGACHMRLSFEHPEVAYAEEIKAQLTQAQPSEQVYAMIDELTAKMKRDREGRPAPDPQAGTPGRGTAER